jgi:hypothetical protein
LTGSSDQSICRLKFTFILILQIAIIPFSSSFKCTVAAQTATANERRSAKRIVKYFMKISAM